MKARETLVRLGEAYNGITVLRNELYEKHNGNKSFFAALEMLRERLLCGEYEQCAAGDLLKAVSDLTSLLMCSGARRVSGDLMLDLVLDTIIHSDNPFARMAAGGKLDGAIFDAMKRDLDAFRYLSKLSVRSLYEMMDLVHEEQKEDNAAKFAAAAWSGAAADGAERAGRRTQLRSALPDDCWSYGEFELREPYFADAALEGLYRRFIEADDWAALTEELYAFHARYGCGDFLKYRHFLFGGSLLPMPDLRAGDFVPLMDAEYKTLVNNALAFLRGESAKPMLLYGGAGMGKTTMMLELTDELPMLRLIYVAPTVKADRIISLFETLRAQPLKFMLLFDDLNVASLSGVIEPMLPQNVLIAATSAAQVLQSLFEVTVELPRLQLNEFVRMVMELLDNQRRIMPQETVRSACIDYQVDTKCEFNVVSAVRVKELLLS